MISALNSIKTKFNLITKGKFINQSKPLGRWNIDYCNKKIDRKIDMSNEDHCGCCSEYIKVKREKDIVKNNKI